MANRRRNVAIVALGRLQHMPLYATATLADIHLHTSPHPPDSLAHTYPTNSHLHAHPAHGYTLAHLMPDCVSL
jgi:hypothetical protein